MGDLHVIEVIRIHFSCQSFIKKKGDNKWVQIETVVVQVLKFAEY